MNIIEYINGSRSLSDFRTSEKDATKFFSDQYYHWISKRAVQFLEKRRAEHKSGPVTQEDYFQYAEENTEFDNVSYEEFIELLRLHEEPSNVIRNNDIRRITNRALIRRISLEMCDDDIKLLPDARYSFRDYESINDKYYSCLAKLGYDGREIEGMPKIITGNYRIFAEKRAIQDEIRAIIEMRDRMQFYTNGLERKNTYYDMDAAISLAFNDLEIMIIREKLRTENHKGIVAESIDNEMKRAKHNRFEKDCDALLIKDMNRGELNSLQQEERDTLLEQTINEKIIPDTGTYMRLDNFGINYTKQKVPNAIRSGLTQFSDLQTWKNVREEFMSMAYPLYENLNLNRKVSKFLFNEFGDNGNPNPLVEVYISMLEANIKRRERKGERVPEEEKEKLRLLTERERRKSASILPDAMLRRRKKPGDIDF